MTEPTRQERITELRRKFSAREGRGGFEQNVQALKEEIARLEAEPDPKAED